MDKFNFATDHLGILKAARAYNERRLLETTYPSMPSDEVDKLMAGTHTFVVCEHDDNGAAVVPL